MVSQTTKFVASNLQFCSVCTYGHLRTLSLGFRVRRMMSAASKSGRGLGNGLCLMTMTTSFGLGVADALYHGLAVTD